MRIIIDIGHPAHVHFFKNFIWQMKDRNHEILLTASDKDVTHILLDAYSFDYITTSKRYSGAMLIYELLSRDFQVYNIARKYKPDIIMGINAIIATHVSQFTRAKSINFTDTEHAKLGNGISFPFSDAICTPSCYRDDIGPKQIRYNGYHELAYLHPNYFTPDPAVLGELGLAEGDPFIIVRFVSWQASHDVGHHGIRDKVRLVRALEQYGRVIITSEGALPPELEEYRMRVSPEKLHDLLYYATLYVGEGGTMASEAAVLGTHAIIVSTLSKYCGIRTDLNKYGLLWISEDDDYTIKKAKELLQNPDLRSSGKYKRDRLIEEKIDVTAYMIWFVENYPDSVNVIKDEPSYPNKFQSSRSL